MSKIKVVKQKERLEQVAGAVSWESLLKQAQDQTRYAKMLLEKAEAHERAVKSMREIALKV